MAKLHRIVVHWFRRMIRLDDNRAFRAALDGGDQVIPLFILDPAILTSPSTGPARTKYLFEALKELDASLRKRGSYLVVRHGDPAEQLEQLVRETKATALYYSRDYSIYSRKRDSVVNAAMHKLDVLVETQSDLLVSEPGEILSQTQSPYTVYTPYKRVWLERPIEEPIAGPETISTPEGIRSEVLPEMPAKYGVLETAAQHPVVCGGEAEALERLTSFLDSGLAEYDSRRDIPSGDGTSRLSAALRMGVISPRRVLAEVRERTKLASGQHKTGPGVFVSEIAWRDFYYQILFHFPRVASGHAFKEAFDAIKWDNNTDLFKAWCEGRTGYPFIDAAQRQLNTEAWMHNRARMVTASFLTKDLLIDWRWGERYFMQRLVDGDVASNNGGWQWAAGTGTDAQPFFRIFNPILQGEKFDPSGDYVKRWVPELARVPAKYIHRPWELSRSEQEAIGCVVGRDYPAPIVDHKVQREKALAMYKNVARSDNEEEKSIAH